MSRKCLPVLCAWLLSCGVALAQTPGEACEQAGAAAEEAARLPPGLLLAIGRVESGRFDPPIGRVAPWPWAIDLAGTPLFFSSSTEAEAAARLLRDSGVSVDVGCFQISLLYHPDAFASLAQAFDPVANARYAARFLTELYARTGSWAASVALYHSATPALGVPYAARVLAAWQAAAVPAQPVTVIAGVRVNTPSTPGAAGFVLTPAAVPLPRVIAGVPRVGR